MGGGAPVVPGAQAGTGHGRLPGQQVLGGEAEGQAFNPRRDGLAERGATQGFGVRQRHIAQLHQEREHIGPPLLNVFDLLLDRIRGDR